MRTVIIAAAAFAALVVARPALADTLSEVTGNGIVLTIGDMDIPVAYTPDHKFTAMDGQVTGTWRIDGDKLCTASNVDPNESCIAYPKDKKSGDTFFLETPQGGVQVKIR
ncbi:MAG TPA: hypothetical protein VGC92_04570 [Phenylobacterium sp.]